jgi:hypothetical protein
VLRKIPLHREAVLHVVEQKHPWQVETGKAWVPGSGSCSNQETIIRHTQPVLGFIPHHHRMCFWINCLCLMIEQQRDPGFAQFGLGAMSKLVGVLHLTAQVERQATDAVVRESIFHNNDNLPGGIQFSGTQGCTDASITSSKNEESVHAGSSWALAAAYNCSNEVAGWSPRNWLMRTPIRSRIWRNAARRSSSLPSTRLGSGNPQ